MLPSGMNCTARASSGYDRASVAGKQPPIEEATDLLIVGAGTAGLAAALAAAGRGVRITLVDENPVPVATMGEDVPLHFGGRIAASAANHNAVLESILRARPRIAEAIEAGVDVRLRTTVWGLFPQRHTTGWIEGHVAGLADEDRTYLLRFGQAIVASGARDMGLAFEGWQRPGVMGALAAHRLARDYEALDCSCAVLLGSGTEALQIGNALMDAGMGLAAIVEQGEAVGGPSELASRLIAGGARLFTRHVIQQAQGDERRVAAVELARVDAQGNRLPDDPTRIPCDTVLLGVAAVPSIELLESAGCAVSFQAARGGHAPVLDESQRTSLPFVYAAGDCAGIWPTKTLSDQTACREGRVAALAALRALGAARAGGEQEPPVCPDPTVRDIGAERLAWVRAMTLRAGARAFVCQCEEVTAADILELNPPRYLGWRRPAALDTRLASLDPGCPPDPDVVKRLTRAGMGACQGRRCREQIAALVALGAGTGLAEVALATYRPPVRPLRLTQLAALPEAAAMSEGWESWFGIQSQWVPFWRLPGAHGAAEPDPDRPVLGE